MRSTLQRLFALCAMSLLFAGLLACGGEEKGGTEFEQNQQENQQEEGCFSSADCEGDEVCVRPEPGAEGECRAIDDGGELGDPCEDSEDCESGLCHEGTCAEECDVQDDCPDGWICVDRGDVSLCEEPSSCSADPDCNVDDHRCVVERDDQEVDLFCRTPVGDGELGDSCTTDADCAAGLCLDGECSQPCDNPEDCGDIDEWICSGEDLGDGEETNVCVERPTEGCLTDAECTGDDRCVARTIDDEVQFVCGEPNDGGVEGGETCQDDADCAQNLCVEDACAAPCDGDDACEFIPGSSCVTESVQRGDASGSVSVCDVPAECSRPDDCPDDEACSVVREDDQVHTLCLDPGDGDLADGETCDEDDECASNFCKEDHFGDYCASPCETGDDCPGDSADFEFECEETEVGSGSIDACVRQDPPACDSENDCDTDAACAIVASEDGDELETVCLPDNGGNNAGGACSDHDDCLSRYCMEDLGICSAPCTDRGVCGNYQICTEETLEKDGASDQVQSCQEMPVTECSASVDCDFDETACNQLMVDDDGDVESAVCGFTNPMEDPLGGDCSNHNDCESDLCWFDEEGDGGECSVYCEETDRDCADEQVCAGMAADLGVCLGACGENADCSGGNVCRWGAAPDGDSAHYYCDHTFGDGETGDECDDASDCITGMCLTMTLYEMTGDSCSGDFDCDSGFECRCPPGEPNCSSADETCVSEQPSEEESRCSEVCATDDGDSVCQDGDHQLTECSDTVVGSWDTGSDTISACVSPAQEE